MRKIRALGIDQGIANCGYALIDVIFNNDDVKKNKEDIKYKIQTITSGVIETEARLSMSNRTFQIYETIYNIIKEYQPDIIGCEQLFLNKNQRSIGMLYVNMATGLLFALSGQFEIPLLELVPGTVKKTITGDGQASKEDVINEITKQLEKNNEDDFVNNEHIADAFGIGLTSGIEFFKKEEYFLEVKKSIKNKWTEPNKRVPIQLMKSEKTKLDKMRSIKNSKGKDPLEISKDVGIPKNTVEKYLQEIKDGIMDKLIQKEKDAKNNKMDKYK